MLGLPYGEEIMIVGRTMWTQCTSVTDGRTDSRTDGRTDRITITKTVQRRVSHGKNPGYANEQAYGYVNGSYKSVSCDAIKPKFRYADFPVTSPLDQISLRRLPETSTGKFRESRRNGIWAKGDVTGLSRTCRCRERNGKVGIVECGL